MDFRDRLRAVIEYKGLSVKELASKTEISYSTFLSYIDARGTLPNVLTAVRLAKILGVSVEWLVAGDEKSEKADIELQALSDEKSKLLDNFCKLSAHDKTLLSELCKSLAGKTCAV
ncbi:MAG: helix-turn-helix transcriptional regulator [Treponema sp.]|nr:helix-turn-helix transcriptional regulator [Treponema sp.]